MTIDRVIKDTNQQVQVGIKISISGAIDSVFKNKKLDENYRESVAECNDPQKSDQNKRDILDKKIYKK